MTVSQEETPYTLGERLRCCRQECQYSVEDIAALLKRKPKTIRQYEDDTRPVPFKDLWLLSCLYWSNIAYFCEPFYAHIAASELPARYILQYAVYTDKFYQRRRSVSEQWEQEAVYYMTDYKLRHIEDIPLLY